MTADEKVRTGVGRWLRLTNTLALALMLVVGTVIASWLVVNRSHFSTRESSANMLARVIETAGLQNYPAGPIEVIDEDGTTPESASRALKTDLPAAIIIGNLQRSCRAMKLPAPDSMARKSDPSLLCEGQMQDSSTSIFLSTRCSSICIAIVRVEVL